MTGSVAPSRFFCNTPGVDVPDATPPPPTPYRDGKPLTDIIPPDRRALKTALLVVASMVTGVALWVTGGLVVDLLHDEAPARSTPPLVPGYVAGRVPTTTLHGPGGDVALPPKTRSVVNVWLQGCQDCMPAFEAMRGLEAAGGLGASVPIVNVSYGEAEQQWAERYGVRKNLVFDPSGAGVVRPLGIGTFTTLVVDTDGSIIHRDRPDRAGYRQRVRAALGMADDEPEPAPAPSGGDPTPAADALAGGRLDTAGVSNVVGSHRAALKRQCWESVPSPNRRSPPAWPSPSRSPSIPRAACPRSRRTATSRRSVAASSDR